MTSSERKRYGAFLPLFSLLAPTASADPDLRAKREGSMTVCFSGSGLSPAFAMQEPLVMSRKLLLGFKPRPKEKPMLLVAQRYMPHSSDCHTAHPMLKWKHWQEVVIFITTGTSLTAVLCMSS